MGAVRVLVLLGSERVSLQLKSLFWTSINHMLINTNLYPPWSNPTSPHRLKIDTQSSTFICSLQYVTSVGLTQNTHFLCECKLLHTAHSLSLTVFHLPWNAQAPCDWQRKSNIYQVHFPSVFSQDLADRIRAEPPVTVGPLYDIRAEGLALPDMDMLCISAPQQRSSKCTCIKDVTHDSKAWEWKW